MTDFETEYIFCKDNRLVLIGECLFAEASTANAELELLKLRPLLREQQLICIKAKSYSVSIVTSVPWDMEWVLRRETLYGKN